MGKEKVRSVCHTKCWWGQTLWDVGDVYEGSSPVPAPADRWFSSDGKVERPEPPPVAGLDPRTNVELRESLKKHPFNFSAPKSWTRKKLWEKLNDFEIDLARDKATAKDAETRAACGRVAASFAGKLSHERRCKKCQEILNDTESTEKEEVDGDSG